MRIISLLIILPLLLGGTLAAQEVSGRVFGENASGQREPLPGVNVYWAGTQQGTATNGEGAFRLTKKKNGPTKIVFSFIGFRNDTLDVAGKQDGIEVLLREARELEGVVISERSSSSFISRTDPIVTHHITTGELQKAACCNLSESFETTASVDVNYSDALSGAKQIKLLGLAGRYSLVQTENFPNLRGLGNTFGLNYIPGPWMESIQVSKGAASVKNGFESTTGQINVEYKKPNTEEKLHINGFASDAGRLEGNANVRWKLSEQLGSVLFLHASRQKKEFDMNMDGFLDEPLVDQINLMNRWEYDVQGKRHHLLGFKILDEQREAGQSAALEHFHSSEDSIYRIDIGTRRYELFTKNGFIFSRPATSLGILASATYHEHNSLFGRSIFDARQTSIYLNAIFETYIGNTQHKLASGASMSYDDYTEDFRTLETDRQEMVPGVFAEYSYSPGDKLTLLVGMRVDNHNLYGTFFTPRAHLRWTPYEHTVLRASAGKGYRTPYLVAENSWIMASSRQLVVEEKPSQEEAWNYGINITQYVDILGRELRLSLDAYRTDFLNQLIVDLDRSQDRIFVYNLKGRSYSNSIQAEAQYELLRGLELTAAFRINDVRTTTNDKLQEQLLVNRYKGLVSMSWQSAMKRWQADLTTQFNGSARLPSTQLSPEIYQRPERSKAHTILLGQVTRYFKTWSIYIGGENLLNYKQKDPIIAADQPYGPWFDAASVWGPVHGRKIYAGFRYTLK